MRVDNDFYKSGVKTLENMKILPQGGAVSREGTAFVNEVKDSSKATRLIRFEFSTDQAYIIEMGDLYMRFYKDNAVITDTDLVITGITKADPAVVTYTGTDPSNGDQVFINNVVGMTEINHDKLFYTVSNVDTGANTFEVQDRDAVDVDSSAYTTYSSGGTVSPITELATSFTEAQIFDVDFVQSADVLFMVHPSHEPVELSRTSDTDWTLAETSFTDGPYLTENSTATTLGLSGTGASTITITASSIVGINDGTGFQTTDVGRLIRWQDPANDWHYYQIDTRSSTTVVICTRLSDATPSATTATEGWRLGAWSDTTGHPETIAFYEQRLFYGATATQPDTVWGSATDDFVNFTPGTNDSDAVSYTLATTRVNRIRWLRPHSLLRIGTSGGEFTLGGSDTSSAITPTNVKVKRESTYGSTTVKPLSIGNATLFWQRAGKKLRELVFNFEVDGLDSPDLTLISEHISSTGVKEMTYQSEPDSIIWVVRTDGELIGLTYMRSENVVGWHRHPLGGPAGTAAESITSIPISDQDQVWTVVNRTINGTTRRYIERITDNFLGDSNNTVKDAVFVDSSCSFTGETPDATLTPGATTGTSITFTAGSAVFASTDVGRHIRTSTTDADGVITEAKATIVTYTDTTNVVVDINEDFASTDAIASGSWTLSKITYDGLDHLEGESVSILADGGTHTNETVTSGSITLDQQATKVHIGYGYTQKIETLDTEGSSQLGSIQGSRARITEFILRLYKSVGMDIGYDENNLQRIDFRVPSDLMDEGVPLFTGDKIIRPPHSYQDNIKMFITQTQPLPLNVLGYVAKVQSSDSR
jgi:hypothetical protein